MSSICYVSVELKRQTVSRKNWLVNWYMQRNGFSPVKSRIMSDRFFAGQVQNLDRPGFCRFFTGPVKNMDRPVSAGPVRSEKSDRPVRSGPKNLDRFQLWAQHLAQALHHNTVRQLVFWSTAYPPLSINIDTHHARSSREQYRCWRGTTSGSSTAQQHGRATCLLIDCISTIIDQYRHSPHSNLARTRSVMKGHNI